MDQFSDLLNRFDKSELLTYLINQSGILSRHEVQQDSDYQIYLSQLYQLIEHCKADTNNKKDAEFLENLKLSNSLNLYKLVSKNLVLILHELPSKVFDIANGLLSFVSLNENGELDVITEVSIIVLIDLFDAFPNSLGSIIGFAVNQIFKIIKKNPNINANLVYLLNSITKNATKLDIDEKTQGKLLKVVTKAIISPTISYEMYSETGQESSSNVLLKKNYMLCFKNLMLLAVSSNYEGLLAQSTSSSSAGAKMKPEVIMNTQHQFQSGLLNTHEKIFTYGLTNYSKEIRIATVESIANLLTNFVPTEKFNPIEYLITLYPLPDSNNWDQSLSVQIDDDGEPIIDVRKEKNTIYGHDSEAIINSNLHIQLLQIGIIESLIFYIQLEQFQNPEFLSPQNLVNILDLVLCKFSDLNTVAENHIQNSHWNKCIKHWQTLVEFLIQESGANCHEILTSYIYSNFSHSNENDENGISAVAATRKNLNKERKRESRLFGFKSKSSSKTKRDPSGKDIKPYHNPYQAYLLLSIIEILLPFGVNFESVAQLKVVAPSEDTGSEAPVDGDDDDLKLEKSNEENVSFIRDVFFRLIVNNDSSIRNYALQTLLVYARNNEVEINQLILHAFRLVDKEYKHADNTDSHSSKSVGSSEDNICGITSVKLLSCSLALLSLIKQTDPTLLQNSTIVKVLSFCTQNLKHNNNAKSSNKNSGCWLILSSLVTLYNSSEYVRLNSSQLLVFWKGLLTSQFISSTSGTSSTNPQEQTQEIVWNLRLRNFSLICLLNYLNSVDLTPESLKQIQFLLTKSYNYISYLESNIDQVGAVTSLNSTNFNEYNYNVNMIHNVLYSNYSFSGQLSSDKIIISFILYSKKILLQSFTRLATLLKNDINSNMIIFLIKLFSDTKLFSRIPSTEVEKSNKSKFKPIGEVSDLNYDRVVLCEDFNYSFGITSKYQPGSANIDELLVKFPFHRSDDDISTTSVKTSVKTTKWVREIFSNSVTELPKSSIEQDSTKQVGAWFDYFERIAFLSVENSINYDPNVLLSQDYSAQNRYSSNLLTSLIDLSIELFQLVFPYLSSKIQFSLLEQIRNSLTAKLIDRLRLKAVQINVSIALHGVVSNMLKKKIGLSDNIALLIIDIIKRIDLKSDDLVKVNSSTIGLTCTLIDKDGTAGQVSTLINDIVTNPHPHNRGFSILSLSYIYRYSQLGFSDIFNISLQLLNDPNPIIEHYTFESMINLFESNLDNLSLIPTVLNKLYSNYLNDAFGYEVSTMVFVNLKCEYSAMAPMTKLLKSFITLLGPALRDSSNVDRIKIRNMIISISYGIGLATLSDYAEVYKYLLGLFQELIIFDPNLIEGEVGFFSELLNLIISKNLKLSLASISSTSLKADAIFPFNNSFDLYSAAYECYYELLKIFGVDILTNKETINLLWISMNIRPCPELKQFIKLWLESSLDNNWFGILNSLFKLSSKKLIGPFIETNYQQKLLPLLQRLKKKSSAHVDFKDEEIENIVGDESDDMNDKNEPITWEFKLFIYELLNHLLDLANKNAKLIERLKSKIQDIVKLSFLGSTSPINEIKVQGIELLDRALGLFGDLEDPLYPGVSILEQQQAQIISTLVPCFAPGNDYRVIVDAINVSSKFINLPRIKFYSKQRILKTLIYLLEEVSANKFLRFGFLESMSEFGRKSIQLSILNCWAVLKIDMQEDPQNNNAEPEFLEILNKYSKLLTSLWILVLREFSTLKYSESPSRELEIYGDYWINLISVLSLELETNPEFVDKYLSGDAQIFFFILFSQCVESLIRNKNVTEILVCVNRLVQNGELINLLFHEEIFGEVIDLFDRLILIDDDTEIQCDLIDIISTIFHTYVKNNENLETGFDKLFELIRVAMLPLYKILPFLRTDYDPTNETNQLLLRHANSAPNLLILRKSLLKLVEIVGLLPEMVQPDLYACLLYIFAKVYESKNSLLISVVIPHLKEVVVESRKFGSDLIETFSNTIKNYFDIDKENNHSVITMIILITNGDVKLQERESEQLAVALLQLLESAETAPTAIQCIKSLIQYSSKANVNLLTIKFLVTDLIKHVGESEDTKQYNIDSKIAFEILFLFTKLVKEQEKQVALYSVLVPLILKYNDREEVSRSYLNEKLLFLVQQSPESFRTVVNNTLSESQRLIAGELVKLAPSVSQNVDSFEQAPEIQLKTFGV